MSAVPPDHRPGAPRRGARACRPHWFVLCGLLLFAPAAARAGGLYRCTGSAGEAVLASSTAGYRDCHAIAGYAGKTVAPAAAVPAAPAAAVAPAPAPAAHWSYRDSRAPLAAPAKGGGRVLRGAVYRVVRADGSVEYTNSRPSGGHAGAVTMLFSYIATCAACDLHSTVDWAHVPLHLAAYADAIRAASAESGVSPAFLRAIIHAESAFDPNALSLKGAQGLMQLMPGTAGELGVLDPFDARQNIRGGARYLARLLKAFGGSERLAAAAYNAGPAAVQRYQGVPPYAETRVYVQRVAELRKRYARAGQSAASR